MIDISSIDKKVYLKKMKRFSSYTKINYTCKQCARLAFTPVHIVKFVIFKPYIIYTCIYIYIITFFPEIEIVSSLLYPIMHWTRFVKKTKTNKHLNFKLLLCLQTLTHTLFFLMWLENN